MEFPKIFNELLSPRSSTSWRFLAISYLFFYKKNENACKLWDESSGQTKKKLEKLLSRHKFNDSNKLPDSSTVLDGIDSKDFLKDLEDFKHTFKNSVYFVAGLMLVILFLALIYSVKTTQFQPIAAIGSICVAIIAVFYFFIQWTIKDINFKKLWSINKMIDFEEKMLVKNDNNAKGSIYAEFKKITEKPSIKNIAQESSVHENFRKLEVIGFEHLHAFLKDMGTCSVDLKKTSFEKYMLSNKLNDINFKNGCPLSLAKFSIACSKLYSKDKNESLSLVSDFLDKIFEDTRVEKIGQENMANIVIKVGSLLKDSDYLFEVFLNKIEENAIVEKVQASNNFKLRVSFLFSDFERDSHKYRANKKKLLELIPLHIFKESFDLLNEEEEKLWKA